MLDKFGINYWAALVVLAPLIVGGLGMVIERLFLKHLYLDKNLRTAADLRFDVDCRRSSANMACPARTTRSPSCRRAPPIWVS
jgi:hypothetical protein